jgi:hypothetical protein
MDEKFKKYLKIKIIGDIENKELFTNPEDELAIEEKIDGANFRFMINNGNIVFGSHTQQITSDIGEDTNVQKYFRRCVDFVRHQLASKDLSKYNNLVFYGECCVMHSISYNWDKIPPFLGFDIYANERFLDVLDAKQIFSELGLDFVPIINYCKVKDFLSTPLTESIIPKSIFYEGQAEGIVVKNYSKQIFAKFVSTKFKEVNKNAFGISKKYAEDDDELIVAKFCTNPRIDKQIFKMLEEGIKLELPMMKYLPNRVFTDMIEEHWRDICFENYTLNFRNVKRIITHRCLAVLKQIIVNSSLKIEGETNGSIPNK